ncbi:LOW QUALITY PROTEIN: hypothetical protein U9M48_017311 [Paspalum notatum var. saurae]|uniref:Reverse transcriptase zinc-binding domain-containing protein n=1 Tax=Paspalum notatum var. saurae TaxID=547442 RepID=A0AAQ3T9H8_PASNO
MDPDVREARAIRALLELFGDATGLSINLGKCSLSPISGKEPDLANIINILGCQVVELPINYLGLPLHHGAIPRKYVQSLVDKVAARLPTWRGSLMARSGRLVWIKSMMTAVPIYTMMANGLPTWARDDIEACCRRFFWAGADASSRSMCAVAWPVVARPLEFGGLGVLDLRLMCLALQVRWLWLRRCPEDGDRTWAGLPLKVAPEVHCLFQASVTFVVGDGRRTLFWTDSWINGKSVEDVAPALLGMVSKRIRPSPRRCPMGVGSGSLGGGAHGSSDQLWDLIRDVSLSQSQDRLLWRWSPNGQFNAYRLLHEGSIHRPEIAIVWKTWAPLRVKLFLWLAWQRRIWTADQRRRHGLEARAACYLCNSADETCDHLLIECSFTHQVWD